MTKPNPIHVAARERVAREVKALAKMLHESCCSHTFHSGHLEGVGEIVKVVRHGNNIHVTIRSYTDPTDHSVLRLQPANIKETDQ